MEKIFNHKSFNYFIFWTPLGSELTCRYIFAFTFNFRSQQPDIVPIICHRWQICRLRRWYRWQPPVSTTLANLVAKLPPVSLIQVANLPSVSLIPAANLPLVSLIPAANLPPLSFIPVVHLDLRISPRIFEKIWNSPNGILWGWGETDSWKKPEAKILVTLSL